MATPTQTHNVLPNPKGEGLDPKEIDIDTNYKGVQIQGQEDPLGSIQDLDGTPGRSPRDKDLTIKKDPKKLQKGVDEDMFEQESAGGRGVYMSLVINILFIVSFIIELDIESANQQNYAMQIAIDDYPYNTSTGRTFHDIASLSESSVWMKDVLFENVYSPTRRYAPNEYNSTINESPPDAATGGRNTDGQQEEGGENTAEGGEVAGEEDAGGAGGGEEAGEVEAGEGAGGGGGGGRLLLDDSKPRRYQSKRARNYYRNLQDEDLENECAGENGEEENYYFISQFNNFKGMVITPTYNPELELPDNVDASDSVYFNSTVSKDYAQCIYRDLDFLLNQGYLTKMQVEMYYFNIVNQIGIFYTYEFGLDENSKFSTDRSVKVFFPKTFDSDSVYDRAGVLIAFRVLFFLTIIVRFFKIIVVDVCKRAKTFIQTHKVDLPFQTLFNVALLFMLLFTLIWGFELNLRMGSQVKSLENISQDQFNEYSDFASDTTALRRILSFAIFFLVVESLLLLNTQFPTFGVLFYTLGKSKNEILFFLILVFTLLTGFVVFLSVNFGLQDTDFSSFGKALMESFQFIVGGTELAKLIEANETWSGIYFFVFYVLFNLLLLLIFVVIIMSTYVSLRDKLQILTLAHAEIAAEKSQILKKKYLRLILFKDPEEEELKEKRAKMKEDEENQPIQAAGAKKEPTKKGKKKNPFEILMLNLEEVDYFGFLNNKRQTREEMDKEIRQKMSDIEERKKRFKEEKKKKREEGVFEKLFNVFVHIIFLIIYLYTMDFELRKRAGFEINSAISDEFLEKEFQANSGINQKFEDVSTIGDIVNWLNQVYFPIIYKDWPEDPMSGSGDLEEDNQEINDLRLRNRLVGQFASRFTFRNLKISLMEDLSANTEEEEEEEDVVEEEEEEEEDTNVSFFRRIVNDVSITDSTQDFETDESIEIGDTTYQRQPQGSFATARKNGGYVVTFLRNVTEAVKDFVRMQHPKILNINTGSIGIQSIWANDNYQIMGFTEFQFNIKATGAIEKQYRTYPFQVNFYGCEECWKRAFLEVLYILFVIRQTWMIVKNWMVEWRTRESKKITPVQPHLKTSKMGRFFNYDFSKCGLWSFVMALFIRIWQFIDRVYTTTKRFFAKSATNLVLTMSIIITFIGIIVLIQLLANEFRINATVIAMGEAISTEQSVLLQRVEEMGRYETIALLSRTYAVLQSINAFFIGIRILFDYGFSKELSLVLELVGDAAFDILFFVLMFFLILFGFALNGYILFGLDTEQFRSIPRSILQVLLIMTSESDSGYMTEVDALMGIIYYILIIVICFLILLKMFIAILDGQFMELTEDSTTKDSEGFFRLILNIITERYAKKGSREIYEKIPPSASRCLKTKIRIKNALKKLKSFIVTQLRLIFLGNDGKGEDPEEKKRIEDEMQKNMVNAKIDFTKKEEAEKEDRDEAIQDILPYKDEKEEGGKKTSGGNSGDNENVSNDEKNDQSSEEAANINEDEKAIPHKWMKILEESLLSTSAGKIQLSKFGTSSKDYAAIEGHLDERMKDLIQEIDEQYQAKVPEGEKIAKYFANNVAVPFYKEIEKKKKTDPEDFEKLADYLYYIYFKCLDFTQTEDEGAAVPNFEEMEEQGEDAPLKSSVRTKLVSPIKDPFKTAKPNSGKDEKYFNFTEEEKEKKALEDFKNRRMAMNFKVTLKELDYENTTLFRENLVPDEDSDVVLLLWNQLSIQHKYLLWAGKYRNKMPLELRHHLWKVMKFDPSIFKFDEVITETIRDQVSDGKLIDLERIRKIWTLLERKVDVDKKKRTDIDLLSEEHIKLFNHIVKGPKQDIIIDLRKMSNTNTKIKYLCRNKHTRDCDKLMLWLLTDPWTKIDLAMREKDNIYAYFTFGLLVEEVFDNTILLLKLERDLNADFKSRIYMHFFFYANLESLVYIQSRQKSDELEEDNPYLYKYIAYLQMQYNSSTRIKKVYKEKLDHIIKSEDQRQLEQERMYEEENANYANMQLSRTVSKTENIDKKSQQDIMDNRSGLSDLRNSGFMKNNSQNFNNNIEEQKIGDPGQAEEDIPRNKPRKLSKIQFMDSSSPMMDDNYKFNNIQQEFKEKADEGQNNSEPKMFVNPMFNRGNGGKSSSGVRFADENVDEVDEDEHDGLDINESPNKRR